MTRLYFGGSFNPLHVGHLLVAQAVAEAGGFDRVVLVPSAQPPHKRAAADMAEPVDRLKMCQLVAEADPLFEVSAIELGRQAPSYTIDTVRSLKMGGEGEVNWLIGADALHDLPKWMRAGELIRETRFWVARRPGFTIDWDRLPDMLEPLKERVVEAPLLDISATHMRQRVAAGRTIRYYVPAEVEQFIAQRGLYR